MVEDEKRIVIIGTNKFNGGDVVGKALEPSMGCLLKTLEGFVEPTYKFGMRRIYKGCRLLAINGFLKRTIEKHIFDIKLVNRLVTGHNKAEN